MDLQAACRAASEAAAHIDAQIRPKLLKHARPRGVTDEGEVIALVEALAMRPTKCLGRGYGRRKNIDRPTAGTGRKRRRTPTSRRRSGRAGSAAG